MTDLTAAELVESLASLLVARKESVATAESCTGGLVAKLMTDLAGSSAWFERGVVSYSNTAKQELLGVPTALFDTDGAVSESCVRAMASGILEFSRADWGVAVTGIAGPGGGTPDKPVGTVWMAWVRRGAAPESEVHQFPGDRQMVRQATALRALRGLVERLGGTVVT